MARLRLTDELLDEVQNWATRRLNPEEYRVIFGLIDELRRFRKHLTQNVEDPQPLAGAGSRRRTARPGAAPAVQCEFMRTIAGHQFRCAAQARYGSFCGFHRQRKLKQRSKGCTAKNRAGIGCKGVVLKDGLCPTHWQKAFGHAYERDGAGFRCALCGETFDYWVVEGKGRDRIGSIKRVATCRVKAEKPR